MSNEPKKGATLEEIKQRQAIEPGPKVVMIEFGESQEFLNAVQQYLETLEEIERTPVTINYALGTKDKKPWYTAMIVTVSMKKVLRPGGMPGGPRLVQ